MRLDPDQIARDKRIDEAVVDFEVAWEARAKAEQEVEHQEIVAATAVERLLRERLSVGDVVKLTGQDPATLRRVRQALAAAEDADRSGMRPASDLATKPIAVEN